MPGCHTGPILPSRNIRDICDASGASSKATARARFEGPNPTPMTSKAPTAVARSGNVMLLDTSVETTKTPPRKTGCQYQYSPNSALPKEKGDEPSPLEQARSKGRRTFGICTLEMDLAADHDGVAVRNHLRRPGFDQRPGRR